MDLPPPQKPPVVIVGAGLAGCTAAYRLQKLGIDVVVYEATNIAGGRVRSVKMGDSVAELGGTNFLDAGDAPFSLALIKELGLKTIEQPLKGDFLAFFDGKPRKIKELFKDAPGINPWIFVRLWQARWHAHNLGEVIDNFFGAKTPLSTLFHRVLRGWEGSETKRLSPCYTNKSLFALYTVFHDFSQYTPSFVFLKGGNSTLIDALTHKMGNKIHYNAPLEAIKKEGENFILSFGNNEEVYAEKIILALPASTLRFVSVEEGIMPSDQKEAVDKIQYGTSAKILLPVQKGSFPAPAVCYTENCVSWLNETETILTLFYGGSPGIFTDPTADLIKKEKQALIEAYPGFTFFDKEATAISWAHLPFAKGSYSNLSPETFDLLNTTVQDHKETVRNAFRSIEGKIFFAGEHTSVEALGTLEGAVESGEKAARMLQRQ